MYDDAYIQIKNKLLDGLKCSYESRSYLVTKASQNLAHIYEVKRLRNSFKNFYGRCPDLIGKYQRSVKDVVADSFPD